MPINPNEVKWDAPEKIDPSKVKWDNEPPKKINTLDRVKAASAGMGRGAIDLAGLPVDAMANTIDLGKALVGGIGKFSGLLTTDQMPTIADRKTIPGSSEWIAAKANDLGAGGVINNPNPQDKWSRILYAGGRGAGASIIPSPRALVSGGQQLANAGAGATSGLIGGAVAETPASEYATVASMLPQLLAKGASSAVKRSVRGDESGRQQMAQRLQDLANAGVENPTVGLASGNKLAMGVENLLAKTPGSMGPMERSREAMREGLQGKINSTRDLASLAYGADTAGRSIQKDLKGNSNSPGLQSLKERIQGTYQNLADKIDTTVPQDARFPINATLGALNQATNVNPLAPKSTEFFVQSRLSDLANRIKSDTTASEPGIYQQRPVNIGLPLSAMKEIRTGIGKEAASTLISGTPEQAEFKNLYGGLSSDMANAAGMADRAKAGVPVGPLQYSDQVAGNALNRANDFYHAGMNRIDRVQPFANKEAPEQAYTSLIQSGKENVSTLRAVKKSISEETRSKIAATTIDRLGRANPSNQDDLGENWSPERFLTNWTTLKPKAREELFSGFGNAQEVKAALDDVARAASMLRTSDKVFSNPSGTASNTAARNLLGGAAGAGGIIGGVPGAAIGVGLTSGAMGGLNSLARLMSGEPIMGMQTNANQWLSQRNAPTPQSNANMQSQLQIMLQQLASQKQARDPRNYE